MVAMPRRFLFVTICLVATVSFLVGLIVAGSTMPTPAQSAPPARTTLRATATATTGPLTSSFADIAEQLNPAVVNIDATTRDGSRTRRRLDMMLPDSPDGFGRPSERDREGPRRGAGTGFIIDEAGYILTNHHVIETADRINVRLSDGRTLRAERIGSDPDTDIALIKVTSPRPLPHAPLGDSDALRVGEWVLAIGNPLAYEHTVTVGVVSFIGRKLFDSSLDRYIQTDAAINFGNSGGPLINARGEVIGINAAISSRASSIGFAVPINGASSVLPQLRARGRVSRGYMGVGLRDVDADLERSLKLTVDHGALVQDITAGSPADRAGLRPYDVITALDDRPIANEDQLIREIAARAPGSAARLRLIRDGHDQILIVKLAERPVRDRQDRAEPSSPAPERNRSDPDATPLGLTVRDLDRATAMRQSLPDTLQGVVVVDVDPAGPARLARLRPGHLILEINRRPVTSASAFQQVLGGLKPGEVAVLLVFDQLLDQRILVAIATDGGS